MKVWASILENGSCNVKLYGADTCWKLFKIVDESTKQLNIRYISYRGILYTRKDFPTLNDFEVYIRNHRRKVKRLSITNFFTIGVA